MQQPEPIIHVTGHTIKRMRERCPEVAEWEDLHVKHVIRLMWRRGEDRMQQGAKYLREVVYHATGKKLVMVWKRLPDRPGHVFVITVLTHRQALKSWSGKKRKRRRAA